jgi:N-acetylglutamate synthase-like GNAT family acetyltransferase
VFTGSRNATLQCMKNISTMEIRLAEHKEAAAISALIYNAFADEKPKYTDKAFAITTPGVAEIEERIKNKTVWVVVSNHVIVGTASCIAWEESLFIRSVAVDKTKRRAGIARMLMNHFEKLALEDDRKYLKLTTTAFLLPACHLYESLGFKQNGFEDCHGTELVKMKKILNPFSFKIKLQKHDHIK